MTMDFHNVIARHAATWQSGQPTGLALIEEGREAVLRFLLSDRRPALTGNPAWPQLGSLPRLKEMQTAAPRVVIATWAKHRAARRACVAAPTTPTASWQLALVQRMPRAAMAELMGQMRLPVASL